MAGRAVAGVGGTTAAEAAAPGAGRYPAGVGDAGRTAGAGAQRWLASRGLPPPPAGDSVGRGGHSPPAVPARTRAAVPAGPAAGVGARAELHGQGRPTSGPGGQSTAVPAGQ